MKLTSALATDFSSSIRGRGFEYYRSGAVSIRKGSDLEVEAKVRGVREYNVEIACDNGSLSLWCDCPFFESTGPCKHLWATILAAEACGYLKEAKFGKDDVFYDLPDPFLDDELAAEDAGEPLVRPPAPTRSLLPTANAPDWRERLSAIGERGTREEPWPANRQLLYLVDVAESVGQGLVVKLMTREPKKAGGWKKPQVARMTRGALESLPDPQDRRILGLLTGSTAYSEWQPAPYNQSLANFRVLHPLAETVVPLIAGTGRCVLKARFNDTDWSTLEWEAGEPWRFELRLERENRRCAITGWLRRGAAEMGISEPLLVTEGGFVFGRDRVARLDDRGAFAWIAHLRKTGRIEAPERDAENLVAAVIEHPAGLDLELPENLRYETLRVVPRPCLRVYGADQRYGVERLRAQLSFDYDGRRVPDAGSERGVYDPATRTFLLRDARAEESARERMREFGFSGPLQNWDEEEPSWRLSERKLPSVARQCLEAGWHLEAEGKVFRKPGGVRVNVASGVDWFELHGEVDYGGATAKLPALLAALRRGENMVLLDDGTYGLLPEEWLRKFGTIAALGAPAADHVRFRRNQAGLLDALLASQPEVSCDAAFAKARDELRQFEGIGAAEQPPGFRGQLRGYQREGVGWMEFLRRFGFGGCLADDMGVGKTAQVLAALETRRTLTPRVGPSLVVVPKSLVFNWKEEAARFTPGLKVLDHTGTTRSIRGFKDCDVVLTTYGTLRRDAAEFHNLEFDYVVLDEAQAIKNAATESAKAARLLRGRHRLALSGTPVENHLGELWSLFEFLNPGLLGAASVFKLTGGAARNPSEETRRLLAHALRPFFLRRTKEQVARELPVKSEQTILCEMDADERKRYDELRAHYRRTLLAKIQTEGLAKSKIHVLEALLRLRQAACHPGLLDQRKRAESSAKLEVLLAHLGEITEEGHKALVFSQFTSLLGIVRQRLDEAEIPYEYLDGQTRDRQARVERFQNDPECRLFLISLKAGGLGLNLTAAEYIFLLDPWWNPAVEAQAIDRAHRIGQTRPVFAYRLIARDTVEEKVLQLQKTKRDLAAAIISEDNSVIRNLQREDLELLLS